MGLQQTHEEPACCRSPVLVTPVHLVNVSLFLAPAKELPSFDKESTSVSCPFQFRSIGLQAERGDSWLPA